MERFEKNSDKDLKIRQESLQNNNTTKNERKAEDIFREYLIQTGEEATSTKNAPCKILVCCED